MAAAEVGLQDFRDVLVQSGLLAACEANWTHLAKANRRRVGSFPLCNKMELEPRNNSFENHANVFLQLYLFWNRRRDETQIMVHVVFQTDTLPEFFIPTIVYTSNTFSSENSVNS